MRWALMSSRPSSNTANRPIGPAPMISASVLITSVLVSPPGTTSVLARLDINFLKELHWPGTVEIGTATAEIGRSSYTFMQAIFHDGVCAATARATMVLIDMETRRSRSLPAQMIERLE